MPGGFHPFHAGHAALYQSAVKAFPDAEVYVAATNDTKTRPFPFSIKEKLAKLAGVADNHFVQVKSPFQAKEITQHYNPDEDVLIFVRSEKDKNEQPKPGGTKKDGSPAYFQPWTGKNLQPFSKHAYIAYLPTVEFGPGITSATEIRNAWPTLNDKRKTAMVMSLYPVTQKNPKLAANVVKMLDMGMGNELSEGEVVPFKQPSKTLTWDQVPRDVLLLANDWFWASEDNSGLDATIDPEGFGNGTANDVKYLSAKLQQKGWTIDFNDEYDHPGEFNLRLTNKRGQNVLLSIEDAQDFTGWAKGTSQYDLEEAEQTAKVFHPQFVDVYFLEGPRREPILVNRKVPYHLIDKYLELVTKKYNLQQGRFEFRNAEEETVVEGKNLSVEQLAHISDKALDDAYHYGRSTPGANFGWMANMQSAKAAKRLIDAGVTDIEAISDAIHKGWNVTAAADYKGQLQLDTPTPDEKKLKRAKLAMQSYSQLPEDEKEKDRVVARALLQAIKGNEVTEGLGIPYPTTYEQENNKFKRRGPMRITDLTEFAPVGGDDREPDEEEILRQLAAQWWNGTEQQMKKAQQTLQAMGWEIGQDESGDDDAGVFVIRIGDVNGDSYIAFNHSDLDLNEDYLNEK